MSGNVSSSNSSAVGSFGGECVPREAPDPCAYVKANPACTAEGLNYLRFIECPAGANDGAAKAVLLVGWCAMLFVAIGTVGDAFFAPAVERIATRLRLPDDVAGATLLALGGAAPDIFTQIAALVESVEPDLRLALSESIGAGLFVATFGKALAVLVGLAWEAKRRVGNDGSHHSSDDHVPHSRQGVAVEPFPYLRDVSAYLAMLILALIAMSSDTVSWELSSALVLSYVLYACVVCFGWGRSAVEPRLVRLAGGVARSPARRTVEDEDEDEEEEEEVAEEADGGRGDVEMSSVGGAPRVRRGFGGGDEDADAEVDAEVEDDEATLLPTGRFLNSAASPSRSTASPPAVSSSSSFVALALAIAEWARVESGLADDRDGVGLGAVAAAPVLLAMSCTMPRLAGRDVEGKESKPRMSRGHLLLVCVVAPVFAMGAAGALGPLSEREPALLACGLGAWYAWAVWYSFRGGSVGANGWLDPGKSRWLTALTFFQGIVWMHLCADELVGLFQAAGRACGVRESLLGATFMSWGASAGDLGGTLAVARRGSTRMAVTASLAGPLCQLSAGTGFAMWLVTVRGGRIEAALAANMKFLAVYGVAAMAFFGGVLSTAYGFVFTRRVACYVMGSYVVAVAVYVALALRSGT